MNETKERKDYMENWYFEAKAYEEVKDLPTEKQFKKWIEKYEYVLEKGELNLAVKRINECKRSYNKAIKEFRNLKLMEKIIDI